MEQLTMMSIYTSAILVSINLFLQDVLAKDRKDIINIAIIINSIIILIFLVAKLIIGSNIILIAISIEAFLSIIALVIYKVTIRKDLKSLKYGNTVESEKESYQKKINRINTIIILLFLLVILLRGIDIKSSILLFFTLLNFSVVKLFNRKFYSKYKV